MLGMFKNYVPPIILSSSSNFKMQLTFVVNGLRDHHVHRSKRGFVYFWGCVTSNGSFRFKNPNKLYCVQFKIRDICILLLNVIIVLLPMNKRTLIQKKKPQPCWRIKKKMSSVCKVYFYKFRFLHCVKWLLK